jgi:SSS family solute:Na+ symporter
MTMPMLDWMIVVGYVVACATIGLFVKRSVHRVADFAVAGRSVGLNMGVAAMTCTGTGMVAMMYTAEMGFRYGFVGAVPGIIGGLASLLVGGTGFMIGPLRKARVITIPELLERNYGKGVRWLAGVVIATGGLLNMGIFLRLAGEFFVHATGLDPAYLQVAMISLLAVAMLYTVVGGMVAVVVTNYLQFLVIGVSSLTVSAMVLWSIPWANLTQGLQSAHQAGIAFQESEEVAWKASQDRIDAVTKSDGPEAADALREDLRRQKGEALRNNAKQLAAQYVLVDTAATTPKALTMGDPLDPTAREGVGVMWLIWQVLFTFTASVTWQTGVSRALSAKNVSTVKWMYRLNTFHPISSFMLPGLWAMGAYLFFCQTGGLPEGISALTAMPEYLARLLPSGLIGFVIAGMLAAEMSTDSSYLVTWATVIYNDVIMPCFRRPLSEKARLLTIRTTVVVIGVFLVFYGLVYELPGTAFDYIAITGTICVASTFTLLIGAIYLPWTNWVGASAALILGAAAPLSCVVGNTMVDAPYRIAPATAGLSAYAMAVGGLIFGSLLGNLFLENKTVATALPEATGGQN